MALMEAGFHPGPLLPFPNLTLISNPVQVFLLILMAKFLKKINLCWGSGCIRTKSNLGDCSFTYPTSICGTFTMCLTHDGGERSQSIPLHELKFSGFRNQSHLEVSRTQGVWKSQGQRNNQGRSERFISRSSRWFIWKTDPFPFTCIWSAPEQGLSSSSLQGDKS